MIILRYVSFENFIITKLYCIVIVQVMIWRYASFEKLYNHNTRLFRWLFYVTFYFKNVMITIGVLLYCIAIVRVIILRYVSFENSILHCDCSGDYFTLLYYSFVKFYNHRTILYCDCSGDYFKLHFICTIIIHNSVREGFNLNFPFHIAYISVYLVMYTRGRK